MKKIFLVISFSIFGLSACTSGKYQKQPVGVGSDIHELKQSPCACKEIEMKLPLDLRA